MPLYFERVDGTPVFNLPDVGTQLVIRLNKPIILSTEDEGKRVVVPDSYKELFTDIKNIFERMGYREINI